METRLQFGQGEAKQNPGTTISNNPPEKYNLSLFVLAVFLLCKCILPAFLDCKFSHHVDKLIDVFKASGFHEAAMWLIFEAHSQGGSENGVFDELPMCNTYDVTAHDSLQRRNCVTPTPRMICTQLSLALGEGSASSWAGAALKTGKHPAAKQIWLTSGWTREFRRWLVSWEIGCSSSLLGSPCYRIGKLTLICVMQQEKSLWLQPTRMWGRGPESVLENWSGYSMNAKDWKHNSS